MWYLRKIASSCEQFDSVSTFLSPKHTKFCFQNLENGIKKIKTNNDNEKKKKISIYFAKSGLFLILKQKVVYLRPAVF